MASDDNDTALIQSLITDLSSLSEEDCVDFDKIENSRAESLVDATLPVKRKRGRPRKIVIDQPEVLLKLPKLRLLKQDIRRSYSLMFLNALNTCDFATIVGFLETFCVPHAQQTTYFKREQDLISESRHGLADMARFWCTNMQFLPDAIIESCHCHIDMSPEHNGNRIVSKFRGKANNIYDVEFPGFSLTLPHAEPFTACAGITTLLEASGRSRKRQRSNSADSFSSTASFESQYPTSLVRSVMEFVNSAMKKLPLKSAPKSMYGEFTLVLYVNDDKMITGMEMIGNHI